MGRMLVHHCPGLKDKSAVYITRKSHCNHLILVANSPKMNGDQNRDAKKRRGTAKECIVTMTFRSSDESGLLSNRDKALRIVGRKLTLKGSHQLKLCPVVM